MKNNKINILLVDDDTHILEAYKDYLENEGFCVDLTPTGKDALYKVRKFPEKYNFILIDLKMGGNKWDGIKTTEEIVKINKDISIIVFSNKDETLNEEIRVKALAAGALRYEKKGKAEEISQLIQNLAMEVKTIREFRKQLNEFIEKLQWLQSTLFASNIGITVIDRTHRIHYMNQHQQNLIGQNTQNPFFCYQLFSNS